MVYLVTIAYLALVIFQVRGFIKNKTWGEMAVYLILMAAALFYIYDQMLGWNLPDVSFVTRNMFEPISNYVFNHLLK